NRPAACYTALRADSICSRNQNRSALAGVKLCSLAYKYGYELMEQHAPVGIAQLDVMVTGSQGKLFSLLNFIGEITVYINRSVLAVGLDLYVSEVCRLVVRRISIRIRIIEIWVENPNRLNHYNVVCGLWRSCRRGWMLRWWRRWLLRRNGQRKTQNDSSDEPGFSFPKRTHCSSPFLYFMGFTVTGFGSFTLRCMAYSGCRSAKLLYLQELMAKMFATWHIAKRWFLKFSGLAGP